MGQVLALTRSNWASQQPAWKAIVAVMASLPGRNGFQFPRQGLAWKPGVREPWAQRGVEALGLKWADLVDAGIFKVAAGLEQSPLRGGPGGCWEVCPCSLLGKMGLCAWLAE